MSLPKENTQPGIDPYEEKRRKLAKEHVDRLDQHIVGEVGAYLLLARGLHLGVNAQGERLTLADQIILRNTLNHLKKQLAGEYSATANFDDLLNNMGTRNTDIKNEIINRTAGR